MKYLLFTFFLFISAPFYSIAQEVIIEDDFEGNGNITSWFGDDCEINTNLANPFPTGINTSNTVLSYHDQGGQYANLHFDVGQNLMLNSESTFSLKVYIPSGGLTGNQPNQLSLKLQDGSLGAPWSTQCEIIKPVALDEWQTLTFNFASDPYINLDPTSLPPTQRSDFNRILIQVNGEDNNDQVLAYIDDFIFESTMPTAPVFNNLVWADEFEVDGPVNSDNWFHQTLLPQGDSWFNSEIQHYTDRTDNTYIEDGILKIVAKKENFTDQGVTKQYTSARLNSKFAFQYGRVEVRAKLPTGIGTWPAIWMLGKNIDEDGGYWDNEGFDTTPWPACGEIDIMEHWGDNQNYVSSALHTPSSYGGTINVGGQIIPTASTAFHVYTLEWTADKMVFSVDDVVHYTYDPPVKNAETWPFDAEQYFLLNVAIQPIIAPTFTSSAMEIDYIRVYQEGPVSSTEELNDSKISAYPNPFSSGLTIEVEKKSDQNIPVFLYNSEGKTVDTFQVDIINQQFTLRNLGHLPKGIYMLGYEIDNRAFSIKLFKE